MKFSNIESKHIKEYRNEVLKTSSASTFDRKVFSLKKFFEWAEKEGHIDASPVEEFLREEENIITNKLGKIERAGKNSVPSYDSFQARIVAKFAGIPKLQKLAYSLFYNRPKWYKSYHSLPISNYFNYAILIILMSALGLGAYNQFFKTTATPLAYPTALKSPSRYLSFQGRLTTNLGNPVTTSTDLVFKLYNADSGGDTLWDSTSCSITPDTDGIFSVLLGSDCGSEISSSVFSENAAVWLGVTVEGDSEATPRVQIATVAYALNAETLQGFPASASATANTVPVINNSGQLVLASSSPKIQSTSGTFAIEGQAMTIATPHTSNGSITINPDGTGTLDLTFEGSAPGGSAGGFVNATNANLASGSLYYGSVAGNATGYNLLQLQSGSSPADKFVVDYAGNVTAAGSVNGLTMSSGTISSGTWNGTAIGTQYGGTGADNSTAAQYSIPYYSTTGVLGGILTPGSSGYVLTTNSTGGAPTWTDAGTVGTNYWQLANHVLAPANAADYDLAIGGNATSSAKFLVNAATGNLTTSGTASVSGTLTLGNGFALQSAYGPLTLNYKSGDDTWSTGLTVVDVSGNVKVANDLYSSTTTANLFNTTTTTLNIGGAASTLAIGAASGATTFGSTTVTLGGSSTLNGGSGSGGTIQIDSTSNATKGNISFNGTTTYIDGLGNLNVGGYATASGSLALGNTTAAAGPGHLDMSGNLTAAGTINGLTVSSGTISSGTWNGTAIGTQYGGTGQDWSAVAQGSVPYFNGTGTMSTLAPGNSGYVLSTNGAGADPTWIEMSATGTNYWQRTSGSLAPLNITDSLNLGAIATSSALVHFAGTAGEDSFINTGKLGIGTRTPAKQLDVIGADGIKIANSGGSDAYLFVHNSSNYFGVRSGTGVPLQLQSNGGTVGLAIDTSGNVGIGDTTPAAAFTVGSGDLFQINSSGIIAKIDNVSHTIDDVSGNLSLTSNGSSVMIADDLGVNGATSADITSTTNTATVFNSTVTSLSIGGAATTMNIGPGAAAATTINIAGGSGATGCSVDGATGNLTCSGTLNGLTVSSGTITGGTWNGTAIGTQYGGTGQDWSAVAQGSLPYFNGAGTMSTLAPGTGGYVLSTNGAGADPTWIEMSATGTNYWKLGSGTVSPFSDTLDLLIGNSATASAKFAFTGVDGGTPNILINNTSVLNDTTLGSGVVNSSLTKVGALASGSIASGFGTIATANTITGTTLNGTTGINTGATAGTQRIDASGNLLNIGNISASGYATASASLALGNTTAAKGPGHLNMSGNLTAAGTINGLTVSSGTISSGTWNGTAIGAAYGGTGQTSYAIGDLLYADSTTSLATLADVATGNVLISGGVGAAPSYGKVALGTHTSGNYVSSLAGTVNQITASGSTGDITLSIPSDFRAPGTVNAVDGIYTGATAGTLRIDALGNLSTNYATTSGSLALGNTTAAAGPGHLNMSGNLTAAGTINGLTISSGTISSGTWNGTAIGTKYGGTGQDWSAVAQGSLPYFNGAGTMSTLAPGTGGYVLSTNGAGADPTWIEMSATGTNYWKLGSGTVSPFSDTLDLLIGNSATASAKFAFKNVLTGVATASISGTTANVSAFIDGNGNISTTNRSNLTLGNSSTYDTTGNILLNPNGTGFVGIGTTTPIQTLDVNGYIRGQRFEDTSSSSYYVDPAATGTSISIDGNIVGNGAFSITSGGTDGDITLDAGSGSVVISGKLDAGTIDPPYTIDGNKYATYVTSMTGVKEETTGNIATSEYLAGQGYRATLDFSSAEAGSDLWLFSNVTRLSENSDKLVVLLSPSANTKAWYSMDSSGKLFIYTSTPTSVSYRLTAPRFDSDSWTNDRNSDTAGFIISDTNNWPGEENSPSNNDLITFENLEVTISTGEEEKYSLTDSITGQIIEEVAGLSQAIIANIKAGSIETKKIAADSFSAFQGKVDNLLVSSGLVATNIQTELISPLADATDVTIQIGKTQETENQTGKLSIQDSQGSEVASIDSEGNATFSGTLYVDKTLYADEVKSKSLDEMRSLLTQVQIDQDLLNQASGWDINATNSANLDEIATADLYITNQAAINSLSVTNSLTIGTDMVFQSVVDGQLAAIENSIDTLTSPLKIQSLAMTPVEIMAGLIKIDTSGNVQIAGNLAVAGSIESSSLNLAANKEATTSGNILSLQDSNGNMVSAIDASGSAVFSNVSTQGLTIAGATEATNSAIVDGVITTNATAGGGMIPGDLAEITIKNPNVTDYTLVYVTPTSSTQNYVLYVKSKSPGEFVVGFTNPIGVEVNFNWWIVKLGQ